MIDVQVHLETDAAAWDTFVRQCPEATVYHLWAWRHVLGTRLGHRPFYLSARSKGRIRGVLPMIAVGIPFSRPALVSLPFVNYGGIAAPRPEVRDALLHAATRTARDIGAGRLELRHRHVSACALPARTHRVSMVRALPGDREALWKTIGPKLRNQVRKANRVGLEVTAGRSELVEPFHYVFVRNMKRLGSPAWHRFLFRDVVVSFPDRARIYVVRLGTLPVAAGLVLRFRSQVDVPWASSLRSHDHLCGNVRMYWQMLADATDAGFTRFDLGRCAPGSAHHRFKRHWGAEEVPLAWHVWPGVPETGGLEARREMLERLWRKLPLWATRLAGPPVRRWLPQ